MAEQLIFDLPRRVALGHDDYFVSDANLHAYSLVTAPEEWPEGKLAVFGPKGCGKTHLARVFAQEHHAEIRAAKSIGADVRLSDSPYLAIEDVDQLAPDGEEALFHIHNDIRHRGGKLLLTASTPPQSWTLNLPDLESRLRATASVAISDPDDVLLGAVLLKLFEDHQITVDAKLVSYLTGRIDRSFEAAARMVTLLDREALARKRKVNRTLAAELLDHEPSTLSQ
jgi:chromosomal replication initiation ATPase DnaA